LHFIGRHPTTLLQCLWNLCWWYDCPEAAYHYDAAAPGAKPRPWHGDGPKLFELLERWRREKQARQPNFVWLRSLRPPALPLGGSHLVLGGHSDTVNAVAVSADGENLVSGSRDATVRLWDTRTGAEKFVFKVGVQVLDVAISLDGRLVAATSAMDNSVKVWNAITGKLIRELGPHDKQIQCIAFSPDARYLAAGSDAATVIVWHVDSGRREAILNGNNRNRTESVAFSPDGTVVLSGGGWGYSDYQYLYVWGWKESELLRRITAHTSLLHRVRFAPDGSRFASCAGDVTGEYTIKIWNAETAAAVVLKGHTESVRDIGFSPDGSRIISGAWDETVRLWDIVSGKQLLKIDIGSQVNCAGFIPGGRRVYSADNVVRLWDSLVGIADAPTRPDGKYNIWRVAYSPDGKFLATGAERGAVVLWDAVTGRLVRELRPWVRGPVNNMVFSPDGAYLAVGTGNVPWDFDEPWSGDSDFDIRIFDVATGTIAGMLSDIGRKVSPRELRYSADGDTIITPPLTGGPTLVWDAKNFSRIEQWTPERAAKENAAAARPNAASPRIKVRVAAPETIFTDQVSGRDIAWLSQPLYEVMPQPGGIMWAGRSDDVHAHQNDARKIDMVALEGQP
jgi:WD40 repeat protein